MKKEKRDWYDGYAEKIVKKDNACYWIHLSNDGGETVDYTVFPGISVCYHTLYNDNSISSLIYDGEVITIDYCTEGRVEAEFRDGSMCYLPERYMSVTCSCSQPKAVSFPLKKFSGVSVVIDLEEMDEDVIHLLDSFMINVRDLGENLKLEKNWFVCRPSEKVEQVFHDLQTEERTISNLRLKVIELLQAVSKMDRVQAENNIYYPKPMIEMTKEICAEMIAEIDNRVTVEQIVEKYDISMVVFYKVFMQIYGDTPYSYIKKYKMNIAAGKLSEGKMKIGDIALEMGYNNPSKFSKAFKSVYGVLPKNYRKKHRQDNAAASEDEDAAEE